VVSCFVFLTKGLQEKSFIIPPEKSMVIGNSIDPLVAFTTEEVNQKIAIRDLSRLSLLFLSNMNPAKGYMDVANAINILKEKNLSCELTADFVGEWLSDEQRKAFEEFIFKNGLQTIITIHNKVENRDEIKKFFHGHLYSFYQRIIHMRRNHLVLLKH
jgi:glycosyltransferase involved in cell wall biosynthesis